ERLSVVRREGLLSLERPISVEQAVRTLSAARNLILDGRLRYHRQSIAIPVALHGANRKRVRAELLNLSQGGIGVHLERNLDVRESLQVSFKLPGTRYTVKA